MKIVVVENNLKFNERISLIVNKTIEKEKVESKIISFYEYNDKLEELIYNKEIKIYILDIEIKGYSGYDIAREIREGANDWDSIIVIASVHNLKEKLISLRLSILTYLLKFDNFNNNLEDTIITAINIFKQKGFLEIPNKYGILKEDILYIIKEKNSKYCSVKTLYNKKRIRESLKKLQNEFNFKRYKKFLLINENNVKDENSEFIIFKDNTKLNLK